MKGKIYTYSIVYSAAEAFQEKTPYVVAVVEDSENNRRLVRVEGYNEAIPVSIGMEVDLLQIDEAGNPVYKF